MYNQNETDETLVLLTLAGEQRAYESLVKRYQKAVIASAAAITGNHFMAEDAAQDAFVTAWMKLNTLQDPKKYAPWVCRIAKNCALSMLRRYRSFLPLDAVDNLDLSAYMTQNPAELYALSEERNEVNKSIEALPQKVREIIYLHYFEDLSVAEIADRMQISPGTVKWQLHDGRKRIRKELCAMNEKYSDTLVQRVMKKVEELKLWQVKNDKKGFEKVYREVLAEVEELPECKEKQHALADVLMRGWWWLPGKKNDALFARIAKAATEGKNEEVMAFIVVREDSKVHGGARIDFIREKQIPRLEKAGFVQTLGREWFSLGRYLFLEGKSEEGLSAYQRAEAILPRGNAFRVLVPIARRMEEALTTRFKGEVKQHYSVKIGAEEIRMLDGKPRYWAQNGFAEGELCSVDRSSAHVFRNASGCDGCFFAEISRGESYIGTDGTKLSYLADNETVNTPAGQFEDCQLWEIRRWTDMQKIVCKTWYKEGVGIVRQDHTTDGITTAQVLKSYTVRNGRGLLPLEAGNTWSYTSLCDPEAVVFETEFSVAFAEEGRVLLSMWGTVVRHKYDESLWLDAVQEIANEYVRKKNGDYRLYDVSAAIERAERLAKTPMEKAHTKAAVSTVKRILETDPEFNPQHTASGHWNFFSRVYIRRKADTLCITDYNPRWSFEWKRTGTMGAAETPILFNHMLGILQDAANCIWSDEWRIGATPIVEYTRHSHDIKTLITCEDGGTVTTKAGSFENCLKLCLDIGGMESGWSYRGGKKAYYFAEGIGIVRTENEFCSGAKTAVYELTSYRGTGAGYMPVADGMMRRYEAQNLTDGFVGAVEYNYVEDEDGDIVVFADKLGIRELPPPVTAYNAILGEVLESRLFDEGKWKEGQMKYGVNNFHLLLHMLGRHSHNRNDAQRSVDLHGFYLKILELLGENGEVPPAWYGLCVWSLAIRAAAFFGNKQKEEGYEMLEKAVTYCEKIATFRKGDLLETGNRNLLGGVKYQYDSEIILLPDGTKEPIAYDYRLCFNGENLYYCINDTHGWAWFNSVRTEDRYKKIVDRVRAIADHK